MAETVKLNTYQGSFGLAFKQARLNGDKVFKWNGRVYGTQLASEGLNNRGLVVTTRLSAQRLANSNKVKLDANGDFYAGNLGEIVVTAPHTKITANSPGFVPTDRTDLVDTNGKSRVYFNTEDRQYYVADNYGNIIGKTPDTRAALNGFNTFISTDGSLSDLLLRIGMLALDRTMINDINLEEKTNKSIRTQEAIHNAKADTENITRGVINLGMNASNYLNHVIAGPIRVAVSDLYTFGDYLKGLSPKYAFESGYLTVGLGDIADVQNETARYALNTINPLSLAELAGGIRRTPSRQQTALTVVEEPAATVSSTTSGPRLLEGPNRNLVPKGPTEVVVSRGDIKIIRPTAKLGLSPSQQARLDMFLGEVLTVDKNGLARRVPAKQQGRYKAKALERAKYRNALERGDSFMVSEDGQQRMVFPKETTIEIGGTPVRETSNVPSVERIVSWLPTYQITGGSQRALPGALPRTIRTAIPAYSEILIETPYQTAYGAPRYLYNAITTGPMTYMHTPQVTLDRPQSELVYTFGNSSPTFTERVLSGDFPVYTSDEYTIPTVTRPTTQNNLDVLDINRNIIQRVSGQHVSGPAVYNNILKRYR